MTQFTINEKILMLLLKSSPEALHIIMTQYLQKAYGEERVNVNNQYIYAYGDKDLPIAVVAHLDTVWSRHDNIVVSEECVYSSNKDQGIGADDRAGIYAILEILRCGYRPTVILTMDEELGGLGAQTLVADFPAPIHPLKYLIELDRRGIVDAVFYDCGNKEFINYFCSTFGYKEKTGSFTDISFITPVWNCAAVNVSIGYDAEHTSQEFIRFSALENCISHVVSVLDYEINHPATPFFDFQDINGHLDRIKCSSCGKECKYINMIEDEGKYICRRCFYAQFNI